MVMAVRGANLFSQEVGIRNENVEERVGYKNEAMEYRV